MSNREKARLLGASTVVVMVITALAMLALPFVMRYLLWRLTDITSPEYVLGYSVAACLMLLPFFLMLLSINKIFSNVAHGIIYDRSNADMLRRVAVCAGLQIGMSAASFVMVYPLFGYEVGIACLLMMMGSTVALVLALVFRHFLSTALQLNGEEGDGFDNR